MTVLLREAVEADLATILRFTQALAASEGRPEAATVALEDLRSAGFGTPRRVRFLLAESEGVPVGYAAWSVGFAMYRGKPYLHVNTVFVEPSSQGLGVGRQLFVALAQRALADGLGRMEWSVLPFNLQAVGFYDRLGSDTGTSMARRILDGPALVKLANSSIS